MFRSLGWSDESCPVGNQRRDAHRVDRCDRALRVEFRKVYGLHYTQRRGAEDAKVAEKYKIQ
jgi:hypothetical protein